MRVMSQGMVRPAFVVAVLAVALPTRAGVLPHMLGMYPQQGAPLPMLDSKVDVTVRGPIVEATVTQTFRNDTDRVTEATYIFPLPVDAAVSAMSIDLGARKIHAAIESRGSAQERYEQAVAAGLGAGLLDQERPDVFTQTVSAIPPKSTVAVTLRFDTTARYADGTWELVLPLVVAPRFVPGTASGRPTTGSGRAPDTDRSPDASRVTPGGAPGAGGATAISIAFQTAVDDVSSPTHELVHPNARYALVDPRSDHDAIVRWRAKAPAAGWVELDGDGGFAAVVLEAPAASAHTSAARCTLVLDRAATTRGDGEAVEHALVRAVLGTLGAKDRVAVTGSDRVDWRAPDQALHALDEVWAHTAGPFDLTKALAATHADGAPIVLISDGLVTDDAAAIAAAKHAGVAVHVIGFGPAPNRSLLAAIANATGGTIRFAIVGDDLAVLARDVIADVSTPPAPLAVSWGTLDAKDVVPATLPRIGAGQATLVLARVGHARAANARARGDVFALGSVTTSKAPVGATTPNGAIARRWARLELDDLIAAGNSRAITDHALAFGLVSPFTSMVAIGDEVIVDGGVKHTRAVPVSVPAGMRWQQVKREITNEKDSTSEAAPGASPPDAIVTQSETKKKVAKALPKPTTHSRREPVADDDADDDKPKHRKRPAHDDASKPASAPVEPSPAPTVAKLDADATGGEDDANVETVSESSEISRRTVRLSAALGTGLVLENSATQGMESVSARVDTGTRTLVGVEGSLWLVGGVHAQGELLGTIGRRSLSGRLELRAGLGVHLGNGAGPAVNLTLRTRLPVRHLALYLRYDGALVRHDAIDDGENAGTLGVEASW